MILQNTWSTLLILGVRGFFVLNLQIVERVLISLYFIQVVLLSFGEITAPESFSIFNMMFALMHVATIVPVVLLLRNQHMTLVGPLLSVVVGSGAMIDIINVATGKEQMRHVFVKKIALAAGASLLTFHHVEQETEKSKGTSMAGALSPRNEGPTRGKGKSSLLLVGRFAICACFVFAALAEFSANRPTEVP